ncbi:MAG: T9SS type B sorting domain-containing protein, partial [Paludibacteraceae bacterium]
KIVFPDSLSIIPAVLFTPNADGINDRWTITNIERFPDSQISIYNRNGKLIRKFKGYDNTQGWDGTDINGNNLPSTDYWYTINVPVIDKIYVGHFTLLR